MEKTEHTWRDIKTAPTDGKKILIYTPGEGVDIAYWGNIGRDRATDCHVYGWVSSGYDSDTPPTHWMELPDAPNAKLTSPPLGGLSEQ